MGGDIDRCIISIIGGHIMPDVGLNTVINTLCRDKQFNML